MNNQLESVGGAIDKSLVAHSKIPELLARQIELAHHDFSLESYEEMLKNAIPTNESTFGGGIFFEPYKYKENLQYFSAFAYWDEGTLKTTQDYSDPEFNYTAQDWYKVATNTDQDVVFTSPYLDTNVNVSMVTATAPFYDENDQFIGVTTADIDLSKIQKMIQNIKVEKTGYAFLIDGQGTYIAAPESEKIMKVNITDDPNQSIAALGKQLIQDQTGILHFKDKSGDQTLFFKKVPDTPWTLGLVVPDKELFSSLNSLLRSLIIVSVIGIILIFLVILFYSNWIVNHVNES